MPSYGFAAGIAAGLQTGLAEQRQREDSMYDRFLREKALKQNQDQFTSGQAFTGTQNQLGRDLQVAEGDKNRTLTAAESLQQRNLVRGEGQANRTQATNLQASAQVFQGGQNANALKSQFAQAQMHDRTQRLGITTQAGTAAAALGQQGRIADQTHGLQVQELDLNKTRLAASTAIERLTAGRADKALHIEALGKLWDLAESRHRTPALDAQGHPLAVLPGQKPQYTIDSASALHDYDVLLRQQGYSDVAQQLLADTAAGMNLNPGGAR